MSIQTKTPEMIWAIAVKNVSGERIPRYAVLRVSEAKKDANGELLVEVDKPNGTGQVLLNSPMPIPIGGFGRATMDYPAPVLFDGTAASLSVGDVLAQEDDNWQAVTAETGEFVCVGTDGDEAIVVAPGGSSSKPTAKIGVSHTEISGAEKIPWDDLPTEVKDAIDDQCGLEAADAAGEDVFVYKAGGGYVQRCEMMYFLKEVSGELTVENYILPVWVEGTAEEAGFGTPGGGGGAEVEPDDPPAGGENPEDTEWRPRVDWWRNTNSQNAGIDKLLQGKEINLSSSQAGPDAPSGGGGGAASSDGTVGIFVDVESCS